MVPIQIAVLSLNQRGFWLASELSRLQSKTNSSFDFNVSFVNFNFKRKSIVYDQMEGPFGGYLTENMEQSFLDMFQSEEPFQIQPQGLTLWSERGPIEARSAFYEKRKETMNPYSFRLFDQFASTTVETKIYKEEFVRANKYRFFTRPYSINSAERARIKLVEDKIKVYEKTDMVDIQLATGYKSTQTQIEFSGEIRGIQNFDFVIWCMTTTEIKHYFPKVYEKLSVSWTRKMMQLVDKPNEHILYDWQAFVFKYDKTPEALALPDHFILCRDSELLVNSETLFVARKSVLEGFYQIWSMIPFSQSMRYEYFEQKAQMIQHLLSEKIKKMNFQLHSLPQVHESPGASLFPVYQNLSAFSNEMKSNFYHSPEVWPSYMVQDQYENMKRIRDLIHTQVMKKFKDKKANGENVEANV